MRSLRLAIGIAAFAAATGAWAYTGGTGLAGTPHDWSSPVTGGGTSGGQALLQWQYTDSKGATVITTYNCMGLNASCAPYMVGGAQGTVRVQFGLCTKCHTPHKAKTQALLWNHTLNTVTYQWEDPKTTSGTSYATFKGDTYKGPTPKCLSCHDGALASTDGVWFNRQKVSGTKYVAAVGSLDSGHEVAEANGTMTGTHPVAMPYPLNQQVSTYNKVSNSALSLTSGWVDDPSAFDVMLYNDPGDGNITRGAVTGLSGIECGSCHDVHNGTRVKAVANPILVTGAIDGSATGKGGYICTQCHKK